MLETQEPLSVSTIICLFNAIIAQITQQAIRRETHGKNRKIGQSRETLKRKLTKQASVTGIKSADETEKLAESRDS